VTGLALVELRRASVTPGRPAARRWLREARRAFPATARPLLDLVGPHPPWPGFADSPAASLEEGLEFVQSTPRSAWRAELADAGARRGRLSGPVRHAAPATALAEPCGTANLAATTGISAASASEHAKALRDADLVQMN
jgi:DNA-binding transcriptional ArsR family regulator